MTKSLIQEVSLLYRQHFQQLWLEKNGRKSTENVFSDHTYFVGKLPKMCQH